MNKAIETLNKIKKELGLSTQEEVIKTEEVAEQVVLADEVIEDKKEVKEAPSQEVSFATAQELSQFKSEVMEMFKQLLEENKKELKEVPQELSKDTPKEVELEEAKEIVHSPESGVESKKNVNLNTLIGFSTKDRINAILNN